MSSRQERFARWDALHATGFVLLAVVLTLGSAPLNALPLTAQLGVLAALTVLIGIPHGGLDLPVARRWLGPRFGRSWAAVFLGGYVLVALPVAAGWILAPGATLGFFLITGAYHFGVSDMERSGLPAVRRCLEGIGRGLAPIVITAWAWPEQVRLLFGRLAEQESATLLAQAAALAGPVALGLLFAAAVLRLLDFRKTRSGRHGAKALELLALPLVFTSLEPLLAFTTYWIGLHAVHVLLIAGSTRPGAVSGLRSVYLQALPTTAATVVLAGVALLLVFRDIPALSAGLGVIFMGLAVLNTPHMVFVQATAAYR
jgi:Brp/Blh family beta-carotene 15,15'-monooxygenase